MVILSNFINSHAQLRDFRRKYRVPSRVLVREGFKGSNGDWMEFPSVAITEAGIRFPLPRLLRELLAILGLHPCQLCPQSYIIIGSILKLNEIKGIDIGVWDILYCYVVDEIFRGVYSLQARNNCGIIQCLLSQPKEYFKKMPVIFVGGKGWEFPDDEVEPIKCRRARATLAEIPCMDELEKRMKKGKCSLERRVFCRDFGSFAAGVYWRSAPILLLHDSSKLMGKLFTTLPIGVTQAKAKYFFSSQKFGQILSNPDRYYNPASTRGSIMEEVDDKSEEEGEEEEEEEEEEVEDEDDDELQEEDGTNVDSHSRENSEGHTPARTDESAEEVDEKSKEEEVEVVVGEEEQGKKADSVENSEGHTPARIDESTEEVVEKSKEEVQVVREEEGKRADSVENSESHTPARIDESTEEVVEKSKEEVEVVREEEEEEEGKKADSVENSENDRLHASSHELHNRDVICALRPWGHETHTAMDPDNGIDDIPSLGIEGHNLVIPFVPESDLVPPCPYGLFKRKQSVHLSAEYLCKKAKEVHDEHGSILNDTIVGSNIQLSDKETIGSMSPDDVVNHHKFVAEKIGEGYISATKEVARLNTLVESLERKASIAENKVLAIESFSQGYQSEILELRERLKVLEARSKEERKQARAEAIEQCVVKYKKEAAVVVNHHYGNGWSGALTAAKVEEASPLWNSESISWPNTGVEFPRPDIKRMLNSDAFSNGRSAEGLTSRRF